MEKMTKKEKKYFVQQSYIRMALAFVLAVVSMFSYKFLAAEEMTIWIAFLILIQMILIVFIAGTDSRD